jgi:uncharacterized cupin superfamily protein
MNVFANEWDDAYPQVEGWRSNYKRLGVGNLGLGLYELLPQQTQCPYHLHYGNDEILIVLQGRPTLRTPDGEQQLEAGDVAQFPTGPKGAHQIVNRTDDPARYIIAACHVSPEVVEHVDSGKVLAMARAESPRGGPLWTVHRLDDAVDYFEGETPRG